MCLQRAWCKKLRIKTINNSRFGIRHLRIKMLMVTWCSLVAQFWSNKLDSKMLYHLGFNNEICRLRSWYAAYDGKSQLLLVSPTSRIEMLQLCNNNGQCACIMIHHWQGEYWLSILWKKKFMKFALCNLGLVRMLPTFCNYAKLQSPTCIMHYAIKNIYKFWIIILDLLVVTSILGVWILMNLLLNVHVLCYLVMIIDYGCRL